MNIIFKNEEDTVIKIIWVFILVKFFPLFSQFISCNLTGTSKALLKFDMLKAFKCAKMQSFSDTQGYIRSSAK